MRTTTRKTLVAIATAAATLMTTSGVSSADPGDVTSLDATVNHPNGPIDILIPGPGSGLMCADLPDPTADVDLTATTIDVNSLSASGRFEAAANDWYQVDMTLDPSGTNSGTLASLGGNNYSVTNLSVSVDVAIRAIDENNGCAVTANTCVGAFGLNATLNLDGSYTGAIPPTSGDTAMLQSASGTGDTISTFCLDTFFGALNGRTVVINDMDFVFD